MTTTTSYRRYANDGSCNTSPTVSSGTWTVTVNQPTINISVNGVSIGNGDYLWSGRESSDGSNPNNWYILNNGIYTSATIVPNGASEVFVVNYDDASVCISNLNYAYIPVSGTFNSSNLYIGDGAEFELSNASNLNVSGDLINNGTFNPGLSTITFNGSGNQKITGTGTTSNFNNLIINKASGTLTLEQPIKVASTLTMINGNILTDDSNILEIGTNKTNTGSISWTAGTIVGPVKRWYGTAANSSQESGIFPVGTTTFNRYAQINFTESTSGGYLIIKYVDGTPANAYSGLPFSFSENNSNKYIQNSDQDGYWEMTPYSESGVAYGALDDKMYNLFLRINNPYSVQQGGILANPPGVRLIRAKGHPDGTHDNWTMAGTHTVTTPFTVGEDYKVGAGGVVGFSWFNGGGDNANPLPVELLSFSGNCTEEGNILTWKTASEHNSAYYELQSSRDGENWMVASTQNAAGNSNEELTYQFMDQSAKGANELYYRLRQVDIDNNEKMYESIIINCDEKKEVLMSFPNPSNNEFRILISNNSFVGTSILMISDDKGSKIISKEIAIVDGVNLFNVNENLRPGVYYIQIKNENSESKIIKHIVY